MRLLATVLAVLATLGALAAACQGGGDDGPEPTITPRPSWTPTVTPTATATPIAVAGLFTDPRPVVVDEWRSLGPEPALFPPWNGTSTMLYDIAAGAATDLGPGIAGRFSPDGRWMAWIAEPTPGSATGEVRVIDLRTHEQRSLGAGGGAAFLADGRLGFGVQGSGNVAIDLATGQRTDSATPAPFFARRDTMTTDDGYYLFRRQSVESPFELKESATGRVLLTFDALGAAPAGRGKFVVVTVPQITERQQLGAGVVTEIGTTNIFLVDYAGSAQFVASAKFEGQAPLAANDDYAAWGDAYCTPGEESLRILDRRSGKITAIEGRHWVEGFTRDGLLAIGEFGAKRLIDPATLAQRAVLRDAAEPVWSDDYRFASTGMYMWGHGGMCWR